MSDAPSTATVELRDPPAPKYHRKEVIELDDEKFGKNKYQVTTFTKVSPMGCLMHKKVLSLPVDVIDLSEEPDDDVAYDGDSDGDSDSDSDSDGADHVSIVDLTQEDERDVSKHTKKRKLLATEAARVSVPAIGGINKVRAAKRFAQ